METEAKYYVPEIEEFRVGFECEYFNRHCEKYIPITIDRSNYNIDDTGDYENDYLFSYRGENKFRVKYLDVEDIESFGFKPDPSGERYFELGGYQLYVNIHPIHNITIYNEAATIIFQGTVKNANELKKVLQMIGVL